MSNRAALYIIILGSLGLAAAVVGDLAQPIKFNHNKHVAEMEMDCPECHQYVTKSRKATLPSRSVCIDCHEEAQGESAEELKLVELLQAGSELNWQRVYELPKHVYFSHFRHVTLGQIGCQKCHGEMRELTSPPTEPATDIMMMNTCLDCHEDRQVTQDCLACHN